jgi:predicted nucleotide-binding protein (sugar kinase/HSP70/actin superfamily)
MPDLALLELLQDEQLMSRRASMLRMGRYLNPDHMGPKALVRAQAAQEAFEQRLRAGMAVNRIWDSAETGTVPDSRASLESLTIGVIGHRYLLFDSALSLSLPARLTALGVRVRTASDVPEGFVFPEPLASERVNWHHEHELLAAARYYLEKEPVDGLLLVSSFACGTAAVVNEIIRRELDPAGIPVMTILLDEHTGESGLSTRLEAFVDMVRHRRAAE